jgi:hypothetical protein
MNMRLRYNWSVVVCSIRRIEIDASNWRKIRISRGGLIYFVGITTAMSILRAAKLSMHMSSNALSVSQGSFGDRH